LGRGGYHLDYTCILPEMRQGLRGILQSSFFRSVLPVIMISTLFLPGYNKKTEKNPGLNRPSQPEQAREHTQVPDGMPVQGVHFKPLRFIKVTRKYIRYAVS